MGPGGAGTDRPLLGQGHRWVPSQTLGHSLTSEPHSSNNMFTGLVEHLGTIARITPTTQFAGFSFLINDAAPILVDCQVGDSIAVNGACLTVTEFDAGKGEFSVNLANETLDRTNLGTLAVGDKVNLERAMSGHGRFGGHFVQGHVDTTATILSITPDGDSLRFLFSLPLAFHTPLLPKGYVALDGTSLTLTTIALPSTPEAQALQVPAGQGVFGVMLIAHTQSRTVVAAKKVGDKVNVECDIVGKGVESIVRNVLEGEGGAGVVEKAVEGTVARVLSEGAGEGGKLEGVIEGVLERLLVKKGLVKA